MRGELRRGGHGKDVTLSAKIRKGSPGQSVSERGNKTLDEKKTERSSFSCRNHHENAIRRRPRAMGGKQNARVGGRGKSNTAGGGVKEKAKKLFKTAKTRQ